MMNWKRTLTIVPLSAALLMPSATAFADGHSDEEHMENGPTVSTPAADLRATLDQYLSEHAYLAVFTMQKGIDGAEDFDQIAGALQANTEDLTGAIEEVYGEEAAQTFQGMWEDHIGFFVDYVTATAEEDEEGRQEALTQLDGYRADFSSFLEGATEERLEADMLAEGLQMHVNQLVGAFDQYNEGDFDAAYSDVRESINHMYGVSKGLSTAIVDQFDEDFEGSSADTPAADLRSDLNYLFSEHAGLAVVAMQKGIDGAGDFDAAAGALNENTEDLTEAISGVYGEEAGDAFNEQWSEHIDFFVNYVVATAEEDEAGQEEALNNLAGYRDTFSQFLSDATENRLEADALSEGLQMHVDQLVTAFDSYTEGDYETTYENVREAYGHMFGVGQMMSGAITDQFPENFEGDMPSEMPATGLGGTAGTENQWFLYGMVLVLLAAGAAMITRHRRSEQ
jgi:hypothetical protein